MAFTRTNFERQIDHAAVLAHGAHPKYRVECDAEVDASTTAKATVNQAIKQGSVVYLDSTLGKYNLGLAAADDQNFPVPFISLKNAPGGYSDPRRSHPPGGRKPRGMCGAHGHPPGLYTRPDRDVSVLLARGRGFERPGGREYRSARHQHRHFRRARFHTRRGSPKAR